MYITVESFGEYPGQVPQLYTLENKNGLRLALTNYGVRVVSLLVPDRNGKFQDVVRGFSELAPYLLDLSCTGATCGRVANRIENACFTLGETTYHVTPNEGPHCIHGGEKGL
ncbi:MAG: galactose-1-epimerase, partial [Clostridia bacterium]|nr:galactose-1-epimerase [Clostridia bacterium]